MHSCWENWQYALTETLHCSNISFFWQNQHFISMKSRKQMTKDMEDYFLLQLCKLLIWFTEQHIYVFKIVAFFLIHQKVSQIMSFWGIWWFDRWKDFEAMKAGISRSFSPGWSVNITRIRSWTFSLPWPLIILRNV